MHFVRAGEGAPPLVFVHGFACSSADWNSQFEEFKKVREVVACDLRGHGRTPGRPQECSIEHYGGDVAALLANLDLRKSILVGHSMGCRVVLEANRIDPERVAGLVLVDGSRLATGDPAAAEAGARAAIDKAGYRAFAEPLFRGMFFRQGADVDAVVARALGGPEIGAALWPHVVRWDAAELDRALAAVRVPVMAIQSTTRGDDMRRIPMKPGDTNSWLDLLKSKGARVEIVPDTGHFTMLEAPAEVNRLLAKFLPA